MYHQSTKASVCEDRQQRLHALFMAEWCLKKVTNAEMARRLGKSLSLVNKIRAGQTPFTGRLIDQFVDILQIDPVRAYIAVDILHEPMVYYSPRFATAVTKSLEYFSAILSDPDIPEIVTGSERGIGRTGLTG